MTAKRIVVIRDSEGLPADACAPIVECSAKAADVRAIVRLAMLAMLAGLVMGIVAGAQLGGGPAWLLLSVALTGFVLPPSPVVPEGRCVSWSARASRSARPSSNVRLADSSGPRLTAGVSAATGEAVYSGWPRFPTG